MTTSNTKQPENKSPMKTILGVENQAPENQNQCQNRTLASRLRGAGGAKECFIGLVGCFLCFECCEGCCECCADVICCPCETLF